MKKTHLLLLVSALAFPLACGGGRIRAPETADREADEEDEDGYVDEEPEEEEDDGDGRFVDSAVLRDTLEPLALDEPTEVPGTGVTMRPPEGAQSMPFGAGFLALRQRVQISVVVAEGEPGMLDAIRTGGAPNAPPATDEDEITIAGQTGRLGRDRVRTDTATLERQWLLVHDGQRGMGIIATYEADRSRVYRAAIRESLREVTWDRSHALDAAAALGIDIGPIEGLEVSHRSTANLVFIASGGNYPPEPGETVLTVSPLPARVPEDQVGAVCGQLIARFVPVPADALEHEGEVEDGGLPGCERLAAVDLQEGRVLTYAALLFHEGTPILVSATADASQLTTWRPRFRAAARTVRVR